LADTEVSWARSGPDTDRRDVSKGVPGTSRLGRDHPEILEEVQAINELGAGPAFRPT